MTGSANPPPAARWLHKATFGFSAAELAAFNALAGSDSARWQAWINLQLLPQSINDSACNTRLAAANFTTLSKSLPQLWAGHHSQTENYSLRMLPLAESESATVIRAIYSKRQLFERAVGFWHDHFSVYGADYHIGPIFPSYDRDVIRAHALGNFRTLLEEVGKSTAMLYYLDNYASHGSNYNENYARELMELHTLGAENYYGPTSPFDVPCVGFDGEELHCEGSIPAGYVDNDVYEAARALTGWTIKNGHWQYPADDDGTFVYRAAWHAHANKIFLGLYIPADQPAMLDGKQVFDRLVEHPGTARRIAGKLCRRFVGDDASAGLIDTVAAVFAAQREAPDQIAQMLRSILESNEFKDAWGGGIKRPLETVMGAMRALGVEFSPRPDDTDPWTTSEEFFSRMQETGHRPFRWGPPNGYPDDMGAWASTGSLAMTLKLLARIPEWHRDRSNNQSPYLTDIVAQTQARFPTLADRSAANMVGDWSDRILGYRPAAAMDVIVDFLRQNAGANDPLDISVNDWDANDLKNHYTQQRLRTAIGMLLMTPEFRRR